MHTKGVRPAIMRGGRAIKRKNRNPLLLTVENTTRMTAFI